MRSWWAAWRRATASSAMLARKKGIAPRISASIAQLVLPVVSTRRRQQFPRGGCGGVGIARADRRAEGAHVGLAARQQRLGQLRSLGERLDERVERQPVGEV